MNESVIIMRKTVTNNTKRFTVFLLNFVLLSLTLVAYGASCSGSEIDCTQETSYGTVDWSTAAHGYITFTAAGQDRCFILQGPNDNVQVFAAAARESVQIALTDGTGRYQYAISNKTEGNTAYLIQYKNSFSTSGNESR